MPRERVVVATPSPPQPLAATLPLSSPSEVARVTPPDPPRASVLPTRARARSTGVLVIVAVLASVLTVGLVLRAVGHHQVAPPLLAPPPLQAITAAPLSEPIPVPVPEPVPASVPIPAPESSPVPVPTVAKPGPPRPKPTAPLPSAAPTSKFKPLFGE
jgi:hypothetical protein